MLPLHELGVAESAEAIRRGEITATALVDTLLARHAAFGSLNSVSAIDEGAVRQAAAEADWRRARGDALGPLHGVPIAAKDNIDIAGLPTAAGTAALRGNVPSRHAAAIQALADAGAIPFGKTGMHELAFGVTSNNAAFGPVRNPYDPSRVPGGSSGGSGAAVGARIVPAALGTDTGASIRLPAAYCGACGFRPTVGRWPLQGIVPISATRDTAGPIARRVADVALLDQIVTGQRAPGPRSTLAGIRLGVPRRFFWETLDAECARLSAAALAELEAAGAVLVDVDLSTVAGAETQIGFAIAFFEFRREFPAYLEAVGGGLDFHRVLAEIVSPDVREVLAAFADGGDGVPEAAYRQAMTVDRPRLIAAYEQAFAENGIDALVQPTSPLLPPPIGDDATTLLEGQPVPTFLTVARNVGPITIAGFPSLSLPIGLSATGLPVGLIFDAPFGCDGPLLSLAMAVEALFPALPAPSPPVEIT